MTKVFLEASFSSGMLLLIRDVMLDRGYSQRTANQSAYWMSQAFTAVRVMRALYQGANYTTALLPLFISTLIYHGLQKTKLATDQTANLFSNAASIAVSYWNGVGLFNSITQWGASLFATQLVNMGELAFANRFLMSGLKKKLAQLQDMYTQLNETLKFFGETEVFGKKIQKKLTQFIIRVTKSPKMKHYAEIENYLQLLTALQKTLTEKLEQPYFRSRVRNAL